MSKPRLYGVPGSRALRSIWAIEEVGIDYELVPTHFFKDSKTPEYLAINPNGKIPALVDGDVTLFESMAINLYLAKKHGGDLYPSDPGDEGRVWQWSFWGISTIEPQLMEMVLHKVMLPEEQRRPEAVAAAVKGLERPLGVLDRHLASRDHLLGPDFTVADLNLAGVLGMSNLVGFDVSAHARVKSWLDRCLARPSYERAQRAGS